MKSLLQYAPQHLLSEANQEAPLLSSILPTSLMKSSAPIEPSKSEWSVIQNPERLTRLFVFEKYEDLKYFIDNLLEYQERFRHHSKMIVDHRSVYIETHTHDVGGVTDSDIALTKFCDEVYEDLEYIRRVKKEKSHAFNE